VCKCTYGRVSRLPHSGNLNKFAFIQVQNQIHRSVRIHELFDHDSHLTALASDSATSPDVYASSMDTVVSTSYDMFNRKLFSLPKLIILPGVIARQPMLLIKIFPFIFITDMLKGRIVASVTDKVEELQREARDVNSVRQKVEQFDMKNAELLRRSGTGATRYTQRRWDELTLEYQALVAAGDILRRTRGFFLWYVSAGELVPKPKTGQRRSQRCEGVYIIFIVLPV